MDQPVFPSSFPPRSAGTPLPTAPTTASNKAPHKAQGAKPGAKDSPSLEAILRIANDAGHSDVHLGVGERPRFRARGEIQATDWPATDDSVFQGWLHEILSPQQIDSSYRDKELDSANTFPFVRVRINVLDSLRGPAVVLRLISFLKPSSPWRISNFPRCSKIQQTASRSCAGY